MVFVIIVIVKPFTLFWTKYRALELQKKGENFSYYETIFPVFQVRPKFVNEKNYILLSDNFWKDYVNSSLILQLLANVAVNKDIKSKK